MTTHQLTAPAVATPASVVMTDSDSLDAAHRRSPSDTDGEREQAPGTGRQGTTSLGWRREVFATFLALGGVIAGGLLLAGATFGGIAMQRALTPKAEPPLSILAAAPGPMLDETSYLHGRSLFAMSCALCHGPEGRGVKGLGKDFTTSEFVASLTDPGLAAFIRRGRDANDPYNTTKVPMPPSGGNPNLTNADLAHVIVYIRGLQDRRRVPESALKAPPVALVVAPPAPPSADEKAAALASAGGDAELAEYIANGNKLYHSLCVACHGKGGAGMPNNGKALVHNAFVTSLDDDGLLAFVKQGRSPSDPKNTTGIQMPPKGGNPALSDDDILDIIAYLRTLQGGAGGAVGAAPGGPASK